VPHFGCGVSQLVLTCRPMLQAPPLSCCMAGEEMTRYCMELILKEWVNPFVDTSKWEYFDCSCKNRDATDDKVRILPLLCHSSIGRIPIVKIMFYCRLRNKNVSGSLLLNSWSFRSTLPHPVLELQPSLIPLRSSRTLIPPLPGPLRSSRTL